MAHSFPVSVDWSGSTLAGYREYSRTHVSHAATAPELRVSADEHFRGDPAVHNPEQLVVIAAASCQMLSFLALAAGRRLDVVHYRDEAVGTMTPTRGPMWIEKIELNPVISVGAGVSEELVLELVEEGHRQCFVANSLRSEIVISPTVQVS